MSQFSIFVPTNNTVKSSNGKTGYAQGIGMILFSFTNYVTIYPLGPFYYFPGHPYITIYWVYLKFYVGFQKGTTEPLQHCDFVDPQGSFKRSQYQNQNN